MLRNPLDAFPRGDLKTIIHRRLEILINELPFPREEILAWANAYQILTAAWEMGDHQRLPKQNIAIAELVMDFPRS
jgi:streptomycin 6-kinase